MNFYKSIVLSLLWPPENIVNSYHSATALAFTFDAVTGATGYEYTTDGGATHRTIQSGVNFTVDSAGNALVENTHYLVQIRSLDSTTDEISDWSMPVDGFTSPAVQPTGKTLKYILNGEGVYLRAGILDGGDAVCQVCFEVDGANTDWMNGFYTGDIIKQFIKIDYSTTHKYRVIVKNIADTFYGDYITIPPLKYFDYEMRAYNVV